MRLNVEETCYLLIQLYLGDGSNEKYRIEIKAGVIWYFINVSNKIIYRRSTGIK